MAKIQEPSAFIKRATKMGLQQMLHDVEKLLSVDLTEAQRITNEEMKAQINKYLEELK